jgi:hypothetical protein
LIGRKALPAVLVRDDARPCPSQHIVSAGVVIMPMSVDQGCDISAPGDLRRSLIGDVRQSAVDDQHAVIAAEDGYVSTGTGD